MCHNDQEFTWLNDSARVKSKSLYFVYCRWVIHYIRSIIIQYGAQLEIVSPFRGQRHSTLKKIIYHWWKFTFDCTGKATQRSQEKWNHKLDSYPLWSIQLRLIKIAAEFCIPLPDAVTVAWVLVTGSPSISIELPTELARCYRTVVLTTLSHCVWVPCLDFKSKRVTNQWLIALELDYSIKWAIFTTIGTRIGVL